MSDNISESYQFRREFLAPRYWLTWFALGVLWLISLLPLGAMRCLASIVGRAVSYLPIKRFDIARRNLGVCFPEYSATDIETLVQANAVSHIMGVFETSISWWWSNKRLTKIIEFQGIEHIENLEGQGAILLAFHFTNLEIGAAAIASQFDIDGMYKPHRNNVYNHVQVNGRLWRSRSLSRLKDSSSRLFARKEIRGMLSVLRKGHVVWYAPDQDFGAAQSIFVDFFGVPAATISATSKLAKVGKAKVLPMVQIPTKEGYRVEILPALDHFPSGDDDIDTRKVNELAERFILQQPQNYLWTHRRFKTRPEGESSIY